MYKIDYPGAARMECCVFVGVF